MNKIDTAMILAAGFGSRLKPLTDNLPKSLVEFKGKPMIENVIGKLEIAGIRNFVINTHHHYEKMIKYFDMRLPTSNIRLIYEKEILGTGGAIKNAEKYLRGSNDFLVYNTDVDCAIDLNEFEEYHLGRKSVATLAVQNRKTSRYLLTDKDGLLVGRKENGNNVYYRKIIDNNIENKAFCGIHILNKSIFDYLEPKVIIDIIPVYISMLKQDLAINTFDITGTQWKDLGIPENL
ncbi:MAG: sugar phosphate nucleotidyltransferase [Ignavibacteria bacterium]